MCSNLYYYSFNLNICPFSHFSAGCYIPVTEPHRLRNYVIPEYYPDFPQQTGIIKPIYHVTTSPKQLRSYVVNNERNGKVYNTVFENCQDWLLSLASSYGQIVRSKIENEFTARDFLGTTFVGGIGGLAASYIVSWTASFNTTFSAVTVIVNNNNVNNKSASDWINN